MAVPILDLNEPARSLFANTVALLEARLPSVLPPGTSWSIGGGTVLAAQWHHRLSTDIDVFLPSSAGIAGLSPQWNTDFVDEMAALGATHVDVQAKGLKFTLPSGRLEITALDATPPLAPHLVRIDGHEVNVLPNTCILAGKLAGRGMRMPVRDVFDICVAAALDPFALRGAVNQFSPQMRSEVAARLLAGEQNYQTDAPREVFNPDPRWTHLLSDGARQAADAMDAFAYKDVSLAYVEGSALVHAETNRGDALSWEFRAPRELLTGLYGIGLGEWVLGHFGTTDAFLKAAENRFASSRNDRGALRPTRR